MWFTDAIASPLLENEEKLLGDLVVRPMSQGLDQKKRKWCARETREKITYTRKILQWNTAGSVNWILLIDSS